MDNFMESIIQQILDILEDKISEKLENLQNEYKKKKKILMKKEKKRKIMKKIMKFKLLKKLIKTN